MESSVRILFIVIIVAAAFYDFRERRIPNFLTVAGMAMALMAHCWISGTAGLTTWLLGLLAGFALLAVPFALGGMGAGDVKLLACAGSMLGPVQVFYAFLAASVFGALLALAAMGSRTKEPGRMTGVCARHIPYGLPLALGVLLSATGAWLRC